MAKTVDPKETTRAMAYALWMKAPNPMVTFFKTLNVANLIRICKKGKKFNMLMLYCIGNAATRIPEFFLLPVGDKLIQYDSIALNAIIKGKNGTIHSCDMPFSESLDVFEKTYLEYSAFSAENHQDIDLSADNMVIGTSAVIDTELDGVVNMYSGYSNPFIIWGRYRKKLFRYELTVSFQFHHTQMDGGHAGCFLEQLQKEIDAL